VIPKFLILNLKSKPFIAKHPPPTGKSSREDSISPWMHNNPKNWEWEQQHAIKGNSNGATPIHPLTPLMQGRKGVGLANFPTCQDGQTEWQANA